MHNLYFTENSLFTLHVHETNVVCAQLFGEIFGNETVTSNMRNEWCMIYLYMTYI